MPPWRRCSRLPDVLESLAEEPPGRADLARRRAITLQAGSHTGGPGTRSGPLVAIPAGQAARNGLCRPPAFIPGAQPLERVQPGEASFNHPALLAQTRAVGDAAAGDPRGDAGSAQPAAVDVVVVAAVGEQPPRST